MKGYYPREGNPSHTIPVTATFESVCVYLLSESFSSAPTGSGNDGLQPLPGVSVDPEAPHATPPRSWTTTPEDLDGCREGKQVVGPDVSE